MLTDYEIKVMQALRSNHYGDGEGGVWSWAIDQSERPTNLPATSLGGVVSSLVKKGFVSVEDYEPGEAVIWFTPKGLDYARTLDR